jgi:cold-inducible RNA-binding protein
MGKRLFVGNLAYATTEPTLRTLFESKGWEVQDVVIVTDRETGRSRGFAFVEFKQDGDADAAMQALDGADLEGRNLTVREAYDRPQRRRGPGPEDAPAFEVERRGSDRRRRGSGGSGDGGGGGGGGGEGGGGGGGGGAGKGRRGSGRGRFDDDDW